MRLHPERFERAITLPESLRQFGADIPTRAHIPATQLRAGDPYERVKGEMLTECKRFHSGHGR